jgi:hypothetical protein
MRKMHKIETPSEWKRHLKTWEESGQVAKHWCQETGVNYQIFLKWRRKLGSKVLTKDAFIEIAPGPSSKQSSRKSSGVCLSISGAQIALTADFDEESLERCLRILKRLSS